MRLTYFFSFIVFSAVSVTAQSAPNSTSNHIQISQYDPMDIHHIEIVDAGKILCMDEYRERIQADAQSIDKTKSREAQFALLKAVLKQAINDAGDCAYKFNYDSSVYQMRDITGMGKDISVIAASKSYRQEREISMVTDGFNCDKVKYKALTKLMADQSRFAKEGAEFMLDTRIFCMSLLGKQSGVTNAMRYFKVTP